MQKRDHRTKHVQKSDFIISTKSDVFLAEKTSRLQYHILNDIRWLNYDKANSNLAFNLFIQFKNAIPENSHYKPTLTISSPGKIPPPPNPPFTGHIDIIFARHILVKKNCSFHPIIKESRYASQTGYLSLDIDQWDDPNVNNPEGAEA